MDWQPIETAPKDGSRILVYSAAEEINICHFEDFGDGGWYRDFTAEYENELAEIDETLYWMPLPNPPKAA